MDRFSQGQNLNGRWSGVSHLSLTQSDVCLSLLSQCLLLLLPSGFLLSFTPVYLLPHARHHPKSSRSPPRT